MEMCRRTPCHRPGGFGTVSRPSPCGLRASGQHLSAQQFDPPSRRRGCPWWRPAAAASVGGRIPSIDTFFRKWAGSTDAARPVVPVPRPALTRLLVRNHANDGYAYRLDLFQERPEILGVLPRYPLGIQDSARDGVPENVQCRRGSSN